jgi:hypothetical protein
MSMAVSVSISIFTSMFMTMNIVMNKDMDMKMGTDPTDKKTDITDKDTYIGVVMDITDKNGPFIPLF